MTELNQNNLSNKELCVKVLHEYLERSKRTSPISTAYMLLRGFKSYDEQVLNSHLERVVAMMLKDDHRGVYIVVLFSGNNYNLFTDQNLANASHIVLRHVSDMGAHIGKVEKRTRALDWMTEASYRANIEQLPSSFDPDFEKHVKAFERNIGMMVPPL